MGLINNIKPQFTFHKPRPLIDLNSIKTFSEKIGNAQGSRVRIVSTVLCHSLFMKSLINNCDFRRTKVFTVKLYGPEIAFFYFCSSRIID